MGLGTRLLGGPYGHADDGSGGHIVHPRLYEAFAAVGFAGRRRKVYDGLVALSGAGPGDRVLDVGCGTGYLSRRVAAAVGASGQVVGVDPSPSVVEYARTVSPPWCSFQIAGGEHIPQSDATFDVAVSSLAVHHVPPELRAQLLAEMYRLLRPAGLLMIADFRPPHGRVACHIVAGLSGHAMSANPIGELEGLITAAGFEVIGSGDRWPSLRYVQARRPG